MPLPTTTVGSFDYFRERRHNERRDRERDRERQRDRERERKRNATTVLPRGRERYATGSMKVPFSRSRANESVPSPSVALNATLIVLNVISLFLILAAIYWVYIQLRDNRAQHPNFLYLEERMKYMIGLLEALKVEADDDDLADEDEKKREKDRTPRTSFPQFPQLRSSPSLVKPASAPRVTELPALPVTTNSVIPKPLPPVLRAPKPPNLSKLANMNERPSNEPSLPKQPTKE